MGLDWFYDFLEKSKNIAGGLPELSEKSGIEYHTLRKWYKKEAVPKIENIDNLISSVGGDIYRAFPNYEYNPKIQGLEVHGRVSAGAVKLSESNPDKERIKISPTLWKNSKLYCHTDSQSATILLKVDGDSMYPDYKDGEYLVCKRPQNPNKLPNGTPCVFFEDNEYTFKNLGRGRGGQIIGMPINHHYECIIFTKSVEIPYIVLGKIDLG